MGVREIPSFYEDERVKLNYPGCSYCGAGNTRLTLDHVLPRFDGGADDANNLVPACRSCNSSKGTEDVVIWLKETKNSFPSLYVLRRYLKLAIHWSDTHDVMMLPWRRADDALPFDKRSLRVDWPKLADLEIWPGRTDFQS